MVSFYRGVTPPLCAPNSKECWCLPKYVFNVFSRWRPKLAAKLCHPIHCFITYQAPGEYLIPILKDCSRSLIFASDTFLNSFRPTNARPSCLLFSFILGLSARALVWIPWRVYYTVILVYNYPVKQPKEPGGKRPVWGTVKTKPRRVETTKAPNQTADNGQ